MVNGRPMRWSMPNSNVPSELKAPDQIRKQRQQKATRVAHLKNKSFKGKNKSAKKGKGRR